VNNADVKSGRTIASMNAMPFTALRWRLPDYDPVGLSEFWRIRNRLGSRVQIYLPQNLADLFQRFGNHELLQKRRSQRLLAELRNADVSEVQAVVKLIDLYNVGLEQEALIR